MRKFTRSALAALLVAALLMTPAAAAEKEIVESDIEYGLIDLSPSAMTPMLMDSGYTWDAADKCYRGQLEGTAGETIYATLETAFLGDSLPELTTLTINGEQQICWEIGKVISENWDGKTDDEFYAWAGEQIAILRAACYAFIYDHPECFYLYTGIAYGYSRSVSSSTGLAVRGNVYLYMNSIPEWDSEEELAGLVETEAAIESAVSELLEATEGMPVVARLAYFDNWLAANNDYNSAAAGDDSYHETSGLPWSAASALLDIGQPVCEGYAKAFQLLCHELGLSCVTISGLAGGGGHTWTAVELGGKWFFSDPTWDDPIYGSTGVTDSFSTRNYFLSAPPVSHSASAAYLAPPELSSHGYFDKWEIADGTIIGGEISSGRLMLAIYAESGRMLGCGLGYAFDWKTGEKMIIAPEFNAETMAVVHHAARFSFGADSWMPTDGMLEF